MTQIDKGVAPEHVTWCEPIGLEAEKPLGPFGRLLEQYGVTPPEPEPKADRWVEVDIAVGTAKVKGESVTVTRKGLRFDTAFVSLWISMDLVNHYWWITRRGKPRVAIARGACYGISDAARAASTAARAELAKCIDQLQATPLLFGTPANKEQVPA
jgi:hypothetical protein